MNALELHGLEKHYPDFMLGPIDLELPGGTVCGLIGENGAGKSTTIKLILDMIDGDAGTVKLFGQEEITPLAKADIGVVLGVKGEAKGYVTLVLSDKLRTLLKMIPLPRKMSKTPDQVEEFNVYAYVKQLIDGNDVSVLLGVADEVVKVMDTLKFYIPTLKDMSMGLKLSLELIRRYLPEGAFSRIYLDEQPVDSGSYVAGAVALESGDLNTAGVAMFKIKPKTEGVRLYWAEDLPAATKAQPFPSSHFRKSSTRDRLTTISNSGRGRAVIFSRLPRYFTMLTIAGMAMMQLRDMRKNRPGSSSSERTSSD